MANAKTCIRSIELTLGDGTSLRSRLFGKIATWEASGLLSRAMTGASISLAGDIPVQVLRFDADRRTPRLPDPIAHSQALPRSFTVHNFSLTLDDGTNISGQAHNDDLKWEGYGTSYRAFEDALLSLDVPKIGEHMTLLKPSGLKQVKSIKVRPDIAHVDDKSFLVIQHNLDDILGDDASAFLSTHELDGTHEVTDFDPDTRTGFTFADTAGLARRVDEDFLQKFALAHFTNAADTAGLDMPVELMSAEEASRRRPHARLTMTGERYIEPHQYHVKMLLSDGEETILDKDTRTYGFNVDPLSKTEQYSEDVISALQEQIDQILRLTG